MLMNSNREPLKILIVEDELIIGAHISSVLQEVGHQVIDVVTKGEKVPGVIASQSVDLILMDIQLAGQLDGIETAKIINETAKIPVIFLTSNVDNKTFEKSKEAFPHAFLSKPFKANELTRTIEVVTNRIQINTKKEVEQEEDFFRDEAIFVRAKDKMVKVNLSDIHYIEADRNYCKIYTSSKVYLLSSSLKKIEGKINSNHLFRTHRSFLVNLTLIDQLDDHYVFIQGKAIPVSKAYKKELNQKLKLI